MRKELQANAANDAASSRIFPVGSEIDSLVIIERTVDLITPMCTQLTYEGLIDEVFRIKSTFVELDPAIVGQPTPPSTSTSTAAQPQPTKPKKVPLNSTDKLYAQLRDLNFTVVGGLLNQVAKRLSNDYEGRHTAKTISDLKDFIGRLGNLQAEHVSLRTHTNIAERISKYTSSPDFDKILEAQQNFVAGIMNKAHLDQIEEMVDKQSPLMTVLRLQCLYSLVEGGIKAKVFDSFRRDIVQTYGYPHTLTLQNLSRAGLLRKQDSSTPKNPYPAIRKAFKLIVDDVNEHKPNDVSYVYSGYAPLSVRLVQAACQNDALGGVVTGAAGERVVGWKGWEEPLRLLPGPTFEEVQKSVDGMFARRSRSQQKVTMVLFLGGCTHTEVSALRFLSMQDPLREYIILTTSMTNGTTMLESLVGKVDAVPLSSGGA
ncbi:hypothetical protein HDV00_011901 [Rhizophlyctis rosea]|nr:hypothetical protein HDV00_011901 [Rhizophlyctis rosea]